MPLPFIDLKSQYTRLKSDIDRRIHAVLEHGAYIMGPEVAELEAKLAAFCGATDAIAVSSGTDALMMALMAEGIGPGDGVFMPAFTFTATAEVVLLIGARPIFVDVDPGTFNIDAAGLRKAIASVRKSKTLKARAIIPVDLFGQPADYPEIARIAAEHDLFVLGDAAQSFGASLNNTRVGALTGVTATSFYPAKPLGCYGDGGAIFVQDKEKAGVLRSIRAHGEGANRYDIVRIGINGRLDSIQAAVLLAKLEIFESELAERERVARAYDARLRDLVTIPRRVPKSTCAWAQYSILTKERDRLARELKAAGIPTAIYYPRPMHLQPAYEKYGDGPSSLPVSERLSQEILSLPMHPYLDESALDAICANIERILA